MVTKSRQEQKAETYGKLCAAATQLFVDQGLEQTSPQDIAAMAGVSVGSFYTHFENKYALLEHLLVNFSRNFLAYVSAVLEEAQFVDLEDALRTHFTAIFDYHTQHPQLSILWTGYKNYISQEKSRMLEKEVEDHVHALYNEHYYATDLNRDLVVQARSALSTACWPGGI